MFSYRHAFHAGNHADVLKHTVLLAVLLVQKPQDYLSWYGVFSPVWMKIATLTFIACLLYHAWVGIRDIWMDYVKPVGLRLALQVFSIVWLLGCAGWAVQVIWRL